jgi:hypothetical protein
VVRELERRDVSSGGVWNASPGLWQRYDVPWNGNPHRARHRAAGRQASGAVYGTPSKYDITIYRVVTTEHGRGRLDGRVALRRRAAVRRPEPGHLPARRAGVAADPDPFRR